MKKSKKVIIILLIFFYFSINIYSQAVSGLAELIDPSLIGKKLSSGTIYNPDENSCITSRYNLLTVLMLENIINGKKTIVYVIDNNPSFKFKDSIISISSRAAKELGETGNLQIAVKITVLKEGVSSVPSVSEKSSPSTPLESEQKPAQTTTDTPTSTSQAATQTSIMDYSAQIPVFLSGKQTNSNYYYIQVGAFKNKEDAITVAQKLRNLGYKVFIYYNNQLYKVIVGPYIKYEEAVEVKKILSSIFNKDKPFIFSSNYLFE
ncbi:MAG: SPOR domain-containing protein [Exilispira sp.]